jgi:hypothetical protein
MPFMVFNSAIVATLACPAGPDIGITVTLIVSVFDDATNTAVTIAVAVSFTPTTSVAESIVNESAKIVALAGVTEKTNNGASKTARII